MQVSQLYLDAFCGFEAIPLAFVVSEFGLSMVKCTQPFYDFLSSFRALH